MAHLARRSRLHAKVDARYSAGTQLTVTEIEDEFCTHALIDQAEGTRVRVIAATEHWPPEVVAERIEEAAKADERKVLRGCVAAAMCTFRMPVMDDKKSANYP